jgi:hypothetical protein
MNRVEDDLSRAIDMRPTISVFVVDHTAYGEIEPALDAGRFRGIPVVLAAEDFARGCYAISHQWDGFPQIEQVRP